MTIFWFDSFQLIVIDWFSETTTNDATIEQKGTTTESKQHNCSMCNSKFKTINAFNKHIKTHNDSTFVCELCGKSFGYQSHLKSHMKRHTKETQEQTAETTMFTCSICGKLKEANTNQRCSVEWKTYFWPFSCRKVHETDKPFYTSHAHTSKCSDSSRQIEWTRHNQRRSNDVGEQSEIPVHRLQQNV